MAFTFVTVTHTYELANDVAAVGTVEFKLVAPIHNGATTVSATTLKATLSGAGVMSQKLAANTDLGTQPGGTTYHVTEYLTGQAPLVYYVQVPHDRGSTVDLADLTGWVSGSSGGSGGAVSSVNSRTGNVTLTASDVGAQPVAELLTRLSAAPVTLTASSGVITPNAASGCVFRYVTAADVQLADPINGVDGQTVRVHIQASGAARTLSFPGGTPAPVIIPSGGWYVAVMDFKAPSTWILTG